MDEFNGVDLNDSFILSWYQDRDSLVIEIEASLWPESKYYSKPLEGEYTCYKKALVSFRNIQSIYGLKTLNEVKPIIEPDGSEDYGNIDTLEKENGQFLVSGEFGNVTIKGGEFEFSVRT
jgi:hypothetical protein